MWLAGVSADECGISMSSATVCIYSLITSFIGYFLVHVKKRLLSLAVSAGMVRLESERRISPVHCRPDAQKLVVLHRRPSRHGVFLVGHYSVISNGRNFFERLESFAKTRRLLHVHKLARFAWICKTSLDSGN